jgi:hypothetical protein
MNDNSMIRHLVKGEPSIVQDTLRFSYISNPDGSIRWIYPSDLKWPSFLNFYNTASLRAKFFAGLIKLSFILRLHWVFRSGEMFIKLEDESILSNIMKRHDYSGFSIFTGTAGENRKIVIELSSNNITNLFVKVGISETSKELVANEARVIAELNKFQFSYLNFPTLHFFDERGVVELSNVKPKKCKQYLGIKSLHVNALSELSGIDCRKIKWDVIRVAEGTDIKLRTLLKKKIINNGLDEIKVKELLKKLSVLKGLVGDGAVLPCGLAHGDFTPWNMYLSDDAVCLFDWELSREEVPLLYDLFHFVFQSEILIRRSSYADIKLELFRVMELRVAKDFVNKYEIDVNVHYLFYLMSICLYYLGKYTAQVDLHMQAHWLICIWGEAVDDLLFHDGVVFDL